jgi:hypothetical protein
MYIGLKKIKPKHCKPNNSYIFKFEETNRIQGLCTFRETKDQKAMDLDVYCTDMYTSPCQICRKVHVKSITVYIDLNCIGCYMIRHDFEDLPETCDTIVKINDKYNKRTIEYKVQYPGYTKPTVYKENCIDREEQLIEDTISL